MEHIDICIKKSDTYLLKEILVHFRNICQHTHEDNIRAVIINFKKRLNKHFENLLQKPEPDSATPEEKLKQLVNYQCFIRKLGKYTRY